MAALRNNFYVGHYKKVLAEAKAAKDNKESELFYYRSMIATGAEDQAIKAIPQNSSPELMAIKMLATYRVASDDTNRELVLEKLKELKEWSADTAPPAVQLIVALIHFEAKNYKEALRFVHKGHEHLEHLALTVQIYLKIDRVDLAARQVKAMQDIDDDDALTTLATAWVYIAQGGDRVQEAFQLLEELVEKFTPSTTVLNTLATCQICLKNFNGAFGYLRQARELAIANKEKVPAETLVNSIVCLQHLHKATDLVTRIIGELKTSYPSHPWIMKYNAMESIFDKQCAQYIVKK